MYTFVVVMICVFAAGIVWWADAIRKIPRYERAFIIPFARWGRLSEVFGGFYIPMHLRGITFRCIFGLTPSTPFVIMDEGVIGRVSDLVAKFIYYHELGHHHHRHNWVGGTLNKGFIVNPLFELEADTYAVNRLLEEGYTKKEIREAFKEAVRYMRSRFLYYPNWIRYTQDPDNKARYKRALKSTM